MSAASLAYTALSAAFVVCGVAALVVLSRRERSPRFTPVLALLGFFPVAYVTLVGSGALRETWVRFGSPLVLYPAAVAVLVAAVRLGRLPASMGAGRRALVRGSIGIALVAAVLAAADVEVGRPKDGLTVVVVADRSRSIDLVPAGETRIADELGAAQRSMRDDDRIAVVAFGAQATLEDPPRPRSQRSTPHRAPVGRDATDVEQGLRRAIAELPSDTAGRIVLVSDGVETRGDGLAAAALALAAEVPIDVLVLEQAPQKNVRLVSLRAPTRADEDEPLDLRIVTQSTVPTDVEIRVIRDGVPLHKARARVQAGEDVLKVREVAPASGLHRYDVEVSALDPAADQSPDDNTQAAFVRVRGVSLALVLEGDTPKAGPMADALRGAGFRVVVAGPSGVPLDVGGFAPYDLVVLSDVRASDLSRGQLDALASYTRDLGGGLLLMGGDRSLGPGGYARTPVEEVSPVSFDLRQKQRRASLAEVIAIDYSGSMGMLVDGQTKLALANEAAARSASLLGPGDRLGVAHVDTAVSWTQPLAPVVAPALIAENIRKVAVGGGGIYTDLALTSAYAALDHEAVSLRHVLLFADGGDAEQLAGCRELVRAAHDRGITTSVISLGEGSDSPELAELAKVGQGRFYLIDDATKLPAVFTQETVLASRSAISEKPFRVAHVGSGPATRGLVLDGAPELAGYVVTAPKARAEVLLAGPEGDPILSTWAAGLGRTAAFTSDYKDRWGSAWLSYPTAGKLFGQLARDTAKRDDDPRVRLSADTRGGTLEVRADVLGEDGRSDAFRRLRVRVAGPNGLSQDLPIEPSGPGSYHVSVPLARKGTYVATLVDQETGAPVGTTAAVLGEGQELTPTGSDRALLSRIARLSGGKERTTLTGLFEDRGPRRFAHAKVAHQLALVAVGALLASVAFRRLAVPEAWLAALRARRVTRAERALHAAERSRRDTQAAIDQAELTRSLAKKTRLRPGPNGVDLASLEGPPHAASARSSSNVVTAPHDAGTKATAPRPADAISAVERLAQRRRERKG